MVLRRRGGAMGTVGWTRGNGALAPFADGYRDDLIRRGHTPRAAKNHLTLMGQLNSWLGDTGVSLSDLTSVRGEEFLSARRASGHQRVPIFATLAPMLEYLRDRRAIPLESPQAPTP